MSLWVEILTFDTLGKICTLSTRILLPIYPYTNDQEPKILTKSTFWNDEHRKTANDENDELKKTIVHCALSTVNRININQINV